jgi:hypothetical protein
VDVRKRTLTIGLALAAAAFAGFALWPAGAKDDEIPSGTTAPQSNGDEELESRADDVEMDDEPQRLARRARQLGAKRQSELREIAVSQHRLPHDVPMADYKAALWSDIKANPPQLEALDDPELDAETAYEQYMYYGMCSMVPRTDHQADQRLEQLSKRAERVGDRHLRTIESRVNQTVEMYDLCSRIPPDVDPRREAMLWMAEAVRLGHEIAQVQYYEKIMGFLLRPDPYTGDAPLAMQRTALVGEFKATARQALHGAMEKGHPEAYLAMSQAVFEGVIYSRDPVMALAYARVAELEAMDNHIILHDLGEHKLVVSQFLEQDQLAEAEQLADDMRSVTGR